MKIKAGDYLLTPEKELFRITDVHTDTWGVHYDIKSLKSTETPSNSNTYTYGQTAIWLGPKMPRVIRSIPRNVLRHMGKIIPQENITKTLKILYS